MSFKLARSKAGHITRTIERPLAGGSLFVQGALLVLDANAAWAECGADPAAIGAVAQSGAGVDVTIGNRLGKTEFPPGYMQGIAVQDEVIFRAKYTGSLPAADGGTYGVTRGGDLIWRVDFAKTGASARVKLVNRLTNSPENVPEVLVAFLVANVQIV